MTTADAAKRAGKVLVAVAHPDDEVVFFFQVIRTLVADRREVHVLCVTGEFGSIDYTEVRRREFHRSCRLLHARPILLGLKDAPGRLDADALEQGLNEWAGASHYERVYTHGVWGEYAHLHHMDFSSAIHERFDRVHSLAGPLPALETHRLSQAQLDAKRRMAANVYASQPAASSWCTASERFTVLRRNEAMLFRWLTRHEVVEGVEFFLAQPARERARLLARARACASAFGATTPGAARYRSWLETLARFLGAIPRTSRRNEVESDTCCRNAPGLARRKL